ncbi:MAG: alpha/beta hydrolase [Chloroflexi bacterium]|nr:MAG: alpha/beta hydrolase [Chloroflexota bacterium]
MVTLILQYFLDEGKNCYTRESMSTHRQLHTISRGSGPTVILLHGYLSSGHYFKSIQKRLAETHHVIAIDLLGFGKSPKPRADYTYDDHITAIHDTIEQLGVTKPYVLIGHSMGALIALRYTTVFADDVRSLQLFNPPIFSDINQMIETHKKTGRHYRMMLYSPIREGYWKALKAVPHNRSIRRPEINFADTVRMSKHAREGSYKNILGGAQFFSDLRKVTVPTSLIVGRYDRLVYQENLQTKELPSNIDLQIVETGHHTLVKNIDLGESLIRQFSS